MGENFKQVQTVIKYHLGEIAASIEPTPKLTLIVRNKAAGTSFMVSTEEGDGAREALTHALENIDAGRPI
jgi:hypothetical protein